MKKKERNKERNMFVMTVLSGSFHCVFALAPACLSAVGRFIKGCSNHDHKREAHHNSPTCAATLLISLFIAAYAFINYDLPKHALQRRSPA